MLEKQNDDSKDQENTIASNENQRNAANAGILTSMFFKTHVNDVETKNGFRRTITLVVKPDSEKVELTLEEFYKMMKFLTGGVHK
jgi:hypothetical protein